MMILRRDFDLAQKKPLLFYPARLKLARRHGYIVAPTRRRISQWTVDTIYLKLLPITLVRRRDGSSGGGRCLTPSCTPIGGKTQTIPMQSESPDSSGTTVRFVRARGKPLLCMIGTTCARWHKDEASA